MPFRVRFKVLSIPQECFSNWLKRLWWDQRGCAVALIQRPLSVIAIDGNEKRLRKLADFQSAYLHLWTSGSVGCLQILRARLCLDLWPIQVLSAIVARISLDHEVCQEDLDLIIANAFQPPAHERAASRLRASEEQFQGGVASSYAAV